MLHEICLSSRTGSRILLRQWTTGSLAAFGLAVCLGFGGSASGQNVSQARIFGVVTDSTGALVPGAKVVITSQTTGYSRTEMTGADGTYIAPQMPADTYRIQASKAGFQTTVATGVLVQVDQSVRRDFTLQIGSVHSVVQVTGQSTLVNTYTAALAQTISGREMLQLPLNNRDVTSLSMLVAGATDPVQTSFYASSAGFMEGTSPSVNGGRIQDNSYFLDGLTNVYSERFTASIYPNPDAVEEFTMNTGQYSAEFGGRPGGQLSARTKSGTNQLHGSIFEFNRNDCCSTRNYFDTRNLNDGIKRNQYGFAVGGPVYIPKVFNGRNKLFWFSAFQNIPYSVRGAPSFTRAWTAAEKTGDFADRLTGKTKQAPSPACNGTMLTVDTGAIFDPRTANSACGSLGVPFQGNAIPSSLFDPVAVNFMKHTPDAPSPSAQIPYFIPQKTDQYQLTEKIDLNLHNKHALMLRYMRAVNSGSAYNDPNDLLFTSNINSLGAHAGASSIGATETWTPSSNLILMGGYEYARWPWHKVPLPNLFTLQDFGSKLTTSPTCKQFGFNIEGFDLLQTTDICGVRLDTLQQFTGSLKWLKGKHEIGIGADYERWGRPNDLGFPNVFDDGSFDFNGGFTGLPEADFLIGRAASWAVKSPISQEVDGLRPIYSAYIEDDFRAFKGLTLNLGLRWDPGTPSYLSGTLPAESWLYPGRQSQAFVNAPTGILYSGDPGTPGRATWFPRYDQFAPRFGFAWDPTGTGRWAVRGGIGSYYGMIQMGGQDIDPSGLGSPPLGAALVTVVNPPNMVNPWAASPYNGTVGIPLAPPTKNAAVKTPFGGSEIADPFTPNPDTYQWSLTIERTFGSNFLLRAGYVGTRGTHLNEGYTWNLANFIPGASTTANIQQRRPDPNFTSFDVTVGNGDSWYNAFQLTVEKRYSDGLSFLASYTLSKSVDTISDDLGYIGSFGTQDPRGPRFNQGLSDFDRTDVFTFAPIWDLPKLSGADPMVKAILGGWTTSAILSLSSGFPNTAVSNGPGCLCGAGVARADVTGTPLQTTSATSTAVHVGYFNQSAFAPSPLGTFGTAGRNTVRGPGFENLDIMLAKEIPIREEMRLQFRFEAFNATNRVNLAAPDMNVNDPNFGKIFSTYTTPRILQFGLKFMF